MRSPFRIDVGSQWRDLEVLRFDGEEVISAIPHFDVLAAGAVPDTEEFLGSLVGERASLRWTDDASTVRSFSGIVTKTSSHEPTSSDGVTFRVTISATFWLLRQRSNSRVFQDVSAVDVIETIMAEHAIAHAMRLTRTYPKREFCVQYQETDSEFVCRIIAEEGLLFFFDQAIDGDVVIVCDDASSYPAVHQNANMMYRPGQQGGALAADADQVLEFVVERSLRPPHTTPPSCSSNTVVKQALVSGSAPARGSLQGIAFPR